MSSKYWRQATQEDIRAERNLWEELRAVKGSTRKSLRQKENMLYISYGNQRGLVATGSTGRLGG